MFCGPLPFFLYTQAIHETRASLVATKSRCPITPVVAVGATVDRELVVETVGEVEAGAEVTWSSPSARRGVVTSVVILEVAVGEEVMSEVEAGDILVDEVVVGVMVLQAQKSSSKCVRVCWS